ncbi:MAG: efflux RND transporter periplasmic adaptor subunit [Rubrivivax sp.]|nr:efflux RND transporter periplasmic adaptor subunit [Rubrivivax sp.]
MSTQPWRSAVSIAAALAGLAALVAGAGWWGIQHGRAEGAAPQNQTPPLGDPSQWTIAQGEAATRRHLRDGLRAGDLDPITGLRIQHYHDPMVPGKNFDAPAKSPFMDMMLVPRYAGAGGTDSASVSISPRIQQNLGLRTAPVVAGALAPEVSATGTVVWNERDQVLLQARATGFVEKLFVRATLDRVAAGAALAEIYVPSWVAAQEDYLALLRMQGPDLAGLRDAALQRMQLAGMDADQIDAVVRSAVLQPRYTLKAPQSGTLTELAMRVGMTVMPGMALARIQGTGSVWAEGQVPESQAGLLRSGTRVIATSTAVPGRRFEGQVQALLPEVDPATRTLKARMELANAGGQLVQGMFVQMRFALPAAKGRLLVPSDAVIHTGRRSVVMLAQADGRFRPVQVVTGLEVDGQTEVLEGLQAGQRVVLSGNFLIDSEASLRGLEARLDQAPDRAAQVHRTDAVVDSVAGDSVVLTHPPIAALKWPEMTMEFKLPPKAERSRHLTTGAKVQIEFHLQDGEVPQITTLRALPSPSKAAAASAPPAQKGAP